MINDFVEDIAFITILPYPEGVVPIWDPNNFALHYPRYPANRYDL